MIASAPYLRARMMRAFRGVAPLCCSRTRIMPMPYPKRVANMGSPLTCTNNVPMTTMILSHRESFTIIPA